MLGSFSLVEGWSDMMTVYTTNLNVRPITIVIGLRFKFVVYSLSSSYPAVFLLVKKNLILVVEARNHPLFVYLTICRYANSFLTLYPNLMELNQYSIKC